MPTPCDADWRSRVASSQFIATVSFEGDDLVLGSGTVLYKLGISASGTISLNADAAHDRMVALLAVAGRGRVAKAALAQLAVALDDWRRGDRGLAAIRLAFVPLPRLRDRDQGYSLFLAETALDAGLSASDLLKELGYSACTQLLKFDPNQPRVPAGSGSRSGQWTSGGQNGGATSTKPAPVSSRPSRASSRPAPSAPESIGPPSIAFRSDDADEQNFPTDQNIEEGGRNLGIGQPQQAPIEGPQPVPPSATSPAIAVPSSIDSPDPSKPDLEAPGTDAAPSALVPGDDDEPVFEASPRGDKGPQCPPQENDIPNGPNPNGDENEYAMSFRINPLNPTPKYSMATPNVVSQAYFLPSDTPRGRTSFDDCKQDDTPALLNIPRLKPGDLFELKAPDWGWLLFYPNSSGFNGFKKQVENQNAAVATEGRGRQIYYCLGTQAVADRAASVFSTLTNSHFLVCH